MPELSAAEVIQIALQHHHAGQLYEAEALYRQVLDQEPNNDQALHWLGMLADQAGRGDLAVDLLARAIRANPRAPVYLTHMGIVLLKQNRFNEAVSICHKAIQLHPTDAETYYTLGVALQKLGRLPHAILACRRAIELRPDYTDAYIHLGVILEEQGKVDQAIDCFLRAIDCDPNVPEAHSSLALAFDRQGRFDEAITSFQRAIRLKFELPEAHSGLGAVFEKKAMLDKAISCWQTAVQLKPDSPEIYSNLGVAYEKKGQLQKAIACYQKAIQIKPTDAEAHNNLGAAFKEQGKLDEAAACYQKAVELQPDYFQAHSNLLLSRLYHPGYDAATVYAEHVRWGHRHADPLTAAAAPIQADRDPDRKLRIGYISADFRKHPVAIFIEPVLTAHDREHFAVICYSDVTDTDDTTRRLMSLADEWCNISGLTDAEVANMIRRDKIDILVDLAGHTAGNRLLVFARRAAPVQVSAIGYPATTGISAIDYRITDALADPPGFAEPLHSEKLVRLPDCFWCYQPWLQCPEPGPLPLAESGRPTFGSFNNLAKIGPGVVQLWARILQAVPAAQLLMKAKGLTDPATQRSIRQQFATHGIQPDRLKLQGWSELPQYMQLFQSVDIALDPYPFTGGTTTCHSLWMGVPVVTLATSSLVSRLSFSLLSTIGLGELIAQTPDEYCRIAADLANDPPRLQNFRSNIRPWMAQSALTDGQKYTHDVESAYRQMWKAWCERGGK